MTAEEAKHALENYVAYFGTYTVDEAAGIVTHQRMSSVQPGDVARWSAPTSSAATG